MMLIWVLLISEFLVGVCKKVSAFVGIITFAYNTLSFATADALMLMPHHHSSSDADADMGADALMLKAVYAGELMVRASPCVPSALLAWHWPSPSLWLALAPPQ